MIYQINLISLYKIIQDYFKQDLKNHILNKLSQILVKSDNLYQFIKLCDNINRWWVEQHYYYNNTITYNIFNMFLLRLSVTFTLKLLDQD